MQDVVSTDKQLYCTYYRLRHSLFSIDFAIFGVLFLCFQAMTDGSKEGGSGEVARLRADLESRLQQCQQLQEDKRELVR